MIDRRIVRGGAFRCPGSSMNVADDLRRAGRMVRRTWTGWLLLVVAVLFTSTVLNLVA